MKTYLRLSLGFLLLIACHLLSSCGLGCNSCGTSAPTLEGPKPWIHQVKTTSGWSYQSRVLGCDGAPPILLLHAMPGPSRAVLDLGKEIAKEGYQVFVPNLYPDRFQFGEASIIKSKQYVKQSQDWEVYQEKNLGPVVNDLRQITREIRIRTGNRVVVIGNCLTGSTPLTLISSPDVVGGILCQPSNPMPSNWELLTGRRPEAEKMALGVTDDDLSSAISALKKDKRKWLAGFHFSNDPIAPMERFDVLQKALSDAGLNERFHTVIAHPVGTSPKSWWDRKLKHRERRTLTGPHSTIVGPKNLRKPIYAKFREELKLILKKKI